jgi:hypothetical protein
MNQSRSTDFSFVVVNDVQRHAEELIALAMHLLETGGTNEVLYAVEPSLYWRTP